MIFQSEILQSGTSPKLAPRMRGPKSGIIFCSAVILLAVSVYGIFHGARASLAQAIYHHEKYGGGTGGEDPRGTFRRCEDAYRLYPYNYYFCIWTAEKAYYNRFGPDGKQLPECVKAAGLWCKRGLDLNYYKSQLRLLETRLLAEESLAEAIKYWGKYVDWQFWEPYNHAVLVEMYVEAGDFSKAAESLAWVKGSKHYKEASRKFREAWKREMRTRPRSVKRSKPSGMPPEHPQH